MERVKEAPKNDIHDGSDLSEMQRCLRETNRKAAQSERGQLPMHLRPDAGALEQFIRPGLSQDQGRSQMTGVDGRPDAAMSATAPGLTAPGDRGHGAAFEV